MPGARRELRLLRVSFCFAFSFALLAGARAASAEEPKLEYADGLAGCREFHAKNERELAVFVKAQPAVPYEYPADQTVLNAPWGPVTSGIGSTYELILASIVPHFGAQLRVETPAFVVAWPWSIPIGPGYTCSRVRGTFMVHDFRDHRIMLEPGIVASQKGSGMYVRPGYRFLYHPSDWVVGAGGGLGSTIDLFGNKEPFRLSISPEALIQFGHCCDSSYFTLTFRYDHYFEGTAVNVLGGTLGYTYF